MEFCRLREQELRIQKKGGGLENSTMKSGTRKIDQIATNALYILMQDTIIRAQNFFDRYILLRTKKPKANLFSANTPN